MKPKAHTRSRHLFSIPAIMPMLIATHAMAVDRYWDSNGTSSGMGGSGNWNTSSNFWRTGAGADNNGGTLGTWVNFASDSATNAILSGTSGTLTTTASISTNRVTVTEGDFIISNGSGGGFSFGGNDRAIVVSSGASLRINPNLSNNGVGLAINGGGTVTFASTNRAYGGALTVTGSGTKVIFLGTNGLSASNASSPHSFAAGTTLQLNGTNNYYSTLTLNGASVDLNHASGLVLQNGGGITVTGAQAEVRSIMTGGNVGGITLQTSGRGMNIGDTNHASGVDLDLSARLTGSGNFSKTGAGTLRLSGNNTFGSGTLTFGANAVDRGYIRLASDNALGNISTIALAGSQGAVSGIQLEGGVTISQNLTSQGRQNATTTGYILRNVSGNNTWNGNVTINNSGGGYGFLSDAGGMLTLAGTVTSTHSHATQGARGITFIGDGDFLVSGNMVKGGSQNSQDLTVSKSGSGTLTLTGTNNDYTGNTNINAGTLALSANAALGNTSTTIGSAATLSGGGSIAGDVTIAGIHSPGNSPGIQSFGGNLSYQDGAAVVWELIDQTALLADRGMAFDGIDVSGVLEFVGNTTINLSFNLSGSLVDWSDSFWDSTYSGADGWLIYSGASDLIGFGNLGINIQNWIDGEGQAFNDLRAGFSFELHQDGNDIYLNYIPEPSTALLGGLGFLIFRRRRIPKGC